MVIRDGEVLRLTVDELQNALAQDAETRDLIVRAYLSRRAIRYELAADLRIIGRGESPEVRRLQQYAQAHHLTSAVIDIDTDEAGHHFLDKVGVTPDALPVVVTRTGAVLHQPDETALAEALPPP